MTSRGELADRLTRPEAVEEAAPTSARARGALGPDGPHRRHRGDRRAQALAAGLSALLGATACRETIGLPDLGAAESVLLVLEGAAPEVIAHDLAAAPRRVDTGESGQLTLLAYERPLAELGLVAGRVAPYTGEDGEPLPAPVRAFTRGEGAAAWAETPAAESAAFRSFRRAPAPAALCAGLGGCYPNPAALACVVPCPQPEPPAAPVIGASPGPRLTPCPEGWIEVERGGVPACDTSHSDTCPMGQYNFPATGCRGVSPGCSADGWPQLPEGEVALWVREGAGGPGTREDPMGSLDRALTESPPAAVVALARGRYPGSHAVSGGRTVAGGCAGEVVLEGEVTVEDGALRALSVAGRVRVVGPAVLEQVEVTGGPTALHVAAGGVLRGAGLAVTAPERALVLDATASASIEGAVLDAPLAALLESSTATIGGATMLGSTTVGGGALDLVESTLRGEGGLIRGERGARVAGRGIVVIRRGASAGAAISLSGATLLLERSRIEVAGDAIAAEDASRSTLEDTLLLAPDGARLGVAVSNRALGIVVARNVRVEGAETAFSVEHTNLLVSASTVLGGGTAVQGGDGAELRVETTRIAGTRGFAIELAGVVNRTGDTYQLADLEITGSAGGLRATRPQIGRISRVSITGVTGAALELGRGGTGAVVGAEDLAIERTGSAESGAILVESGVLDVLRVRLRDLGGAGLILRVGGSAEITHGHIDGAPIGVAAFGPRGDPRALLGGLLLERVAEPCRPCGE